MRAAITDGQYVWTGDQSVCTECDTLTCLYLIEPEPGYVALRYRPRLTELMLNEALETWNANEGLDERERMCLTLEVALKLCVATYNDAEDE